MRSGVGVVIALGLLGSTAGCTYWFPHSLVASDRPLTADPTPGKRVEASSCRLYILFVFPAGGEDPTIDNVMSALHDKASKATAFRDLRFDEAFTNYVLAGERCVSVTAEPLYTAAPPKPKAHPPGDSPSSPPAEAPPPGSSDTPPTPDQ
jgi:hypothetical protein